MNIIRSLLARRPGQPNYEMMRKTRCLKGTKFEYIYRARQNLYLLGSTSGRFYQCMRKGTEQFRKADDYDFRIIDLPQEALSDRAVYAGDITNLIIPYLANSTCMCDEGTYEEFGVSVREGDVVIDAGANVGIFTAFAARYRGAVVHAFEPVSETYNILEKTVELNRIGERVVINRMGLGDHIFDTEIAFDLECDGKIGSSTIVPDMSGYSNLSKREKIKITTIDQYVTENRLERIDFIKADIEGSERNMLRGATETLRRFKPQLAICTYHLPDDVPVLTKIIKDANPDYYILYGPNKLYAR